MRKKFGLLLCCIMSVSIIAGCGDAASETQTGATPTAVTKASGDKKGTEEIEIEVAPTVVVKPQKEEKVEKEAGKEDFWGGIKSTGTVPERIVLMDSSESAAFLQDEKQTQIKAMLDEDGALYETYSSYLGTTTVDTFLGYDVMYHFNNFCSLNQDVYMGEGFSMQWYPNFHLAFSDDAAMKEGRKVIERFFGEQQVDDFQPWKAEVELYGKNTPYTTYIVEQSDDKAEEWFPGYVIQGSEGGRIYKCVDVAFLHLDEKAAESYFSRFPAEKTYSRNVCMIMVYFMKWNENGIIQKAAQQYQYDVLAKEDIDLDGFKASVAPELLEAADDGWIMEYYPELYNQKVIKLYFMEKYNFDLDFCAYLDDEMEKRRWYIKEFSWDISQNAPVDLSEYADSKAVYCAMEDNYNLDTSKFFESEVERAAYLVKKAYYNPQTKRCFNSDEEVRLWFIKMFTCDYDIKTGEVKELGRQLARALVAYQKFMDKNENWLCALIYLNEDDIPELIAYEPASWHAGYFDDTRIYTYHIGKLEESNVHNESGFGYKEGKNCIRISGGRQGSYYEMVSSIQEGKWVTTFDGRDEILNWDTMETNYYVNGNKVTKAEYDKAYEKAFPYKYGEYQYSDDHEKYSSVLEAYDAVDYNMFFLGGGMANESSEETEPRYRAGVYTDSANLGSDDDKIILEVVLDANYINSVRLIMEESIATMYPLMEPALQEIEDQLTGGVLPENVEFRNDMKYTQLLLMEVINRILEKAKLE